VPGNLKTEFEIIIVNPSEKTPQPPRDAALYCSAMPRIALMAGSFDPFTIGHHDIVMRGLEIFDSVIICVGLNRIKADINPGLLATAQSRADAIKRAFEGNDRVKVIVSKNLTAVEARNLGARFLLRGVRSVRDFEYERDMADINFSLEGLETVMLPARPHLAAVSSSVVRDIAAYGRDVSQFIP